MAQCGFSPTIFSSTGSFSFCQGSNLTLTANPTAGATFVWKRNGVATGQTASAITVSDAAAYRVLITIAGCTDSATVNTSINPPPMVSLSILASLKSVCSNAGSFSLVSYGSPAGGTWFINGSPGFPNIIPALGANTYAIEYRYTDILGCTNSAFDTVRVLAQPTVILSAIPAVCENEDPVSLAPYGTPAGGTWSGIGVFAGNQFDPATSGLITLTYAYTDPNSGCIGTQSTQVLVNAAPNVTFNPFILPDQCEGDMANSLSGFVSPTPGSSLFTSSFRGNGIVNPSTGLFNPDSASIGSRDTIWYTAQNNLTTCADSTFSLITVNPKPIVTLDLLDSIVCITDPIFNLSGGNPSGGSYLGQAGNVVGGRYNPGFAGAGVDTVYYLFFDFNGCSDIASHSLEVKPVPTLTLNNLPIICENDTSLVLNQGLPIGGTYSGNGVYNDSLFSPGRPGVSIGLNPIRYNYTDSFGCSGSVVANLQINAKPVVNFSMDPNLCTNEAFVDLANNPEIFTEPLGGSFFRDTVLSDTLLLQGFLADSIYPISYFYSDGAGCSDTATSFFQMHDPPTFTFTTRGEACIDVPARVSVTEEYQYEWSTGESSQEIRPIIDRDTLFTVTVTDFFCSNSDSVAIRLIPPSNMAALPDSISTPLETVVILDPFANDSGRLGQLVITDGPSNGSIVITGSEIEYTPDFEFRRIDSIAYEVCDEICENICVNSLVKINVLGDPYDFIPNAFTPDGDGTNDFFIIPGIEAYPDNSIRVYNVQGEVVYSAQPYVNDWDGTLSSAGLPGIKAIVPDGTYYYVLTLGEDKLSGDLDIKTK